MNILPLLLETENLKTFKELVTEAKKRMSICLRHQRYEYGNLINDLNVSHENGALYHIRISYEDFEFTSEFGDLKVAAYALSNYSEIDPLAIYMRDYHREGFDIRLVYNKEYFTKEIVQSIAKSIDCLISSFETEIDISTDELKIITDSDRERIVTFGCGNITHRHESTFLDLWHLAVQSYADRIAVSVNGRRFTYSDINRKACEVSNYLHSICNIRQGDRVALILSRSEIEVISILGCMMAGACYIPIDWEDPDFRKKHILDDCECRMVITDRGDTEKSGIIEGSEMRVILFEEISEFKGAGIAPPLDNIRGEDPCYIIYTSGSTGNPKGILISHYSMLDYVCTFREYFELTCDDSILHQASLGFDTSVEEIFPILSVGGRLHILDNRKDLGALYKVFSQREFPF